MKLSFNQICQFTAGAVSVQKASDGIHFYRYTQKQTEAFEKEARCFYKRALHTSGIRIDFYTNSSTLRVEIGAEGKYKVMIDRLTAFCQKFDAPGYLELALETGRKRVTIILPSHLPGVIRSVQLDDGSEVSAVTYPCNFIFYGDSITQGWDSEKDSQSYAWLVSRYYDANSMILGVGGSNFYPDTVDDNGFNADVAVVAMGTNDYCGEFTLEQIRSNCAEYLKRVSGVHPKAKLFFITPIWRADGEDVFTSGTLSEVRNALAEEAVRQNITVIDGYTLVPHRTEYFADGFLHPNDIGFALYAQNLIKALNRYL